MFTIARYAIRPEVRADAERAMHEFASHVRQELPDSAWVTYRAPTHYVSLLKSNDPVTDARRFEAAIAPFLAGDIERTPYELVTSSDLAPRHRAKPDRRRR